MRDVFETAIQFAQRVDGGQMDSEDQYVARILAAEGRVPVAQSDELAQMSPDKLVRLVIALRYALAGALHSRYADRHPQWRSHLARQEAELILRQTMERVQELFGGDVDG